MDLEWLFSPDANKAIAILCAGIGIIGAIYAIFGGLKAVAVSATVMVSVC